MDDKLKHRLVGATVILALMAFFLPLILDSEKYRSSIKSQIPAQPAAENKSNLTDVAPVAHIDATQDSIQETGSIEQETGTLIIDLNQTDSETVEGTKELATQNLSEEAKSAEEKPLPTAEVVAQKVATDEVDAKDAVSKEVSAATKETAKEAVKEVVKAPTQSEEAVKEAAAKEIAVKVAPVEPSSFQHNAWVVQMGSFSNKENASKLVTRLRSSNYRAYQRTAGTYSRVFVGPYPDKEEAEKRQKGLEKLVGSSVKLLEFDPKAH